MKYFRCSLSLMIVLVWALTFIGCAKPPEAEKAAASAAMTAAITAGADKYATADLGAAKKILDSAEAQMKEKKYEEAKKGYVDARAAFDKATGAVAAGRQAAINEANASVAALEDAWMKLGETAKTLDKKMKDKKDAWIVDSAAFPESVKKIKETIIADPLGSKAKIAELKAVVDKWDAAFKELAAAPEPPQTPVKPPAKKK